ncbi:MAG: CbtB-domain containing protein [Roseibium sp.]|uniref:CbtB domain-containing protein n=1 Tax=Roseibium sp. TaxID=1936156 RepID=UPI0026146549|nr:CbtB domain-containing protein [Roseibium sp.]MCV0424722.1 CbtB-domain containing protein [Roseibium sp.]
MTTQTAKTTLSATKIVSLAFAAVLGVAIISITGHVQAGALHDAAHDVRHATGFPCH